MANPTPHGQVTEALEDFEVRKLAAIGAVRTSSGLVERRPIEYRRELEDQFVRGFRAAEKRLSALSAAPTITPETGNSVSAQGAAITSESGAVYAELPDFDSGDEPIWEAVFKWKAANPGPDASKKAMAVESAIIKSLRDFADRTHALRMQAAPKAAPGEPEAPAKSDARKIRLQSIILALVRLSCAPPVAPALEHQLSRMIDFYFESGDAAFARQLQLVRRGALNGGSRSKLIPSAAPQQEAQEPGEIDRLRAALVYTAFALHGTPQYMLADGITLIDGDTVQVSRDGWKVQASANPLRQSAQPAPAPLSDDVVKDAARYRWLREHEGADGLIRSDCRGLYLPQRDALDSAVDALLFTTPSQRGEIAGDGKPCNNDHDPDCRWPDCRCRERERMAAAIPAARARLGEKP